MASGASWHEARQVSRGSASTWESTVWLGSRGAEVATAGAIRAPTDGRERTAVLGVARNCTAHVYSIQANCYLGAVAETRVRTIMPQQLLCCVRAARWQKVRLKFLYVLCQTQKPMAQFNKARTPHEDALWVCDACVDEHEEQIAEIVE